MRQRLIVTAGALSAVLLASKAVAQPAVPPAPPARAVSIARPALRVSHFTGSIRIDGRLDERAWYPD